MKQQESIGKWISALYRHLQIQINKEFEQYRIGSGQIHVFMRLLNTDGVNQETIAKDLNLDKATVGRAVEVLINEGYVSREIDRTDHRAYNLHVTAKGRKIEPAIKKTLNKLTSTLLSDFNKAEKELALELLKRMHHNIISAETL
jgi:DNA-binding MarR family transcriptional regulator